MAYLVLFTNSIIYIQPLFSILLKTISTAAKGKNKLCIMSINMLLLQTPNQKIINIIINIKSHLFNNISDGLLWNCEVFLIDLNW